MHDNVRRAYEVQEVEVAQPAEVGGVWLIASVGSSRKPLKLANRFEALAEQGMRIERQRMGVERQGMGVDPQGMGVEGEGVGGERQGMGVERQSMGVERQGTGIEQQGMGIERQGMGVGGQGIGVEEQCIKKDCAVEVSKEQQCGMLFHMADSKRMFASVDKITAAGNEVMFGPAPADNYVMSINTTSKILLKNRNGVFIMELWSIVGDQRVSGEIIVDSGASECVMPKEMQPNLQNIVAKAGVRFAVANGAELGPGELDPKWELPRGQAALRRSVTR